MERIQCLFCGNICQRCRLESSHKATVDKPNFRNTLKKKESLACNLQKYQSHEIEGTVPD